MTTSAIYIYLYYFFQSFICINMFFFFFQAEDGIRDYKVTGVQTCALPIFVKIGKAETDPEDIKLARECWQAGREAIYSGKYDLVVLDEINYTISYEMLDPEIGGAHV